VDAADGGAVAIAATINPEAITVALSANLSQCSADRIVRIMGCINSLGERVAGWWCRGFGVHRDPESLEGAEQ
jgi:hypothetical protein